MINKIILALSLLGTGVAFSSQPGHIQAPVFLKPGDQSDHAWEVYQKAPDESMIQIVLAGYITNYCSMNSPQIYGLEDIRRLLHENPNLNITIPWQRTGSTKGSHLSYIQKSVNDEIKYLANELKTATGAEGHQLREKHRRYREVDTLLNEHVDKLKAKWGINPQQEGKAHKKDFNAKNIFTKKVLKIMGATVCLAAIIGLSWLGYQSYDKGKRKTTAVARN